MIDLTLPQAFVSDFSNVFELIIIYRLVTNYLSKKIILIDVAGIKRRKSFKLFFLNRNWIRPKMSFIIAF